MPSLIWSYFTALARTASLRGREDGVHAAQHQQRQHHRAVLVLLERPPKLVGDLPDERDLVLEADRRHLSPSSPPTVGGVVFSPPTVDGEQSSRGRWVVPL